MKKHQKNNNFVSLWLTPTILRRQNLSKPGMNIESELSLLGYGFNSCITWNGYSILKENTDQFIQNI